MSFARPFKCKSFRSPVMNFMVGLLLFALSGLATGCGTGDAQRLKASRDSFLHDDFKKSEESLYNKEVFEHSENRFIHYSSLASIALAAGEYEKANYFLLKARDLVNGLRSSHSGFSWFSSDYLSNGIEYSYLHYFLVMTDLMLAEDGKTPAWTTPEIKAQNGDVIVQAQSFPARVYTSRDIADLKQKAHAELLAWDTHLQNLKGSVSDLTLYHNDLWARMLASYLHSLSDQNSEKRTGELLAKDAEKILESDFQNYPSKNVNQAEIESFIQRLEKRDPKQSLFVLEAGVMSKYKIKRFHIGLSTLFRNIKDPGLRMMIERIGFQIVLQSAPEFGLVLFSGAVAGAISGSSSDEDTEYEGPPRQFSEAIDNSFGFLIQFPSLESPPPETKVKLDLSGTLVDLPVVSPLQEMISTDLKNRESKEMLPEAITVGLEYLAVLIPAIKTYHAKNSNFLTKVAAVAGFYMAKKIIDNAHRPDIRSWNYLPKLIAADVLPVPPGNYHAKVYIDNASGRFEKDLGDVQLGDPEHSVVRRRVGDVSLLNTHR